jgi:hypothetical protein
VRMNHFLDLWTDSESRKESLVVKREVCLRRSSRVNPFVRLPFELIRWVFELATNDRRTGLSLRLVSKVIHRWITPIMFRTVKLYREFKPRGRLHCLPNTHMTANLYFCLPISKVFFPNSKFYLEDYSSLQNLSVRWDDLPAINPWKDIEIPTLTHLTLRGSYRGVYHDCSDLCQYSPMFRSITHLYFTRSECRILPRMLPPLPHLTHVVWGFNIFDSVQQVRRYLIPFKPTDTLQVIGIELQVLPLSVDMALYAATGVESYITPLAVKEKMLSAVRECSFRDKQKIVVMSRDTNFDPREWNTWFHGGENIWETAERLLSEREQSKSVAEQGSKGGPAREP